MSTRDFVEKDYYAALGVAKTASADEIKKAYRKLARQHHPDANNSTGQSEERFKELSEAYDVLSDAKRRREYDEARALFASGAFRRGPGGNGFAGGGGFSAADLGDLFGDGSLGDLLGGMFGRGGGRGARRGGDLETEVRLDFVDAVNGATVPLHLASPATCGACHGSGARPGTTPRVCATCGGQGAVAQNQGAFSFSAPCRDCRGQGRIVDSPCLECGGRGETTSERTLNVRIPAGVADGQRIRLKGKGLPGQQGGPAGDLIVLVHVAPHHIFGRRDDHLTLTIPVSFPEAALGAEIRVPTLDGTVTLRIPAGTTTGRTFRVRGQGVPRKNGSRGDLLVTVEVAVPQKLSRDGRRAVEALAKHLDGDPREHLLTEVASRA